MKKIRIQNLRSLKDTKEIEIKPLTVLVGRNSSGKSTFLRFFPLIKQTLETRTNEPVLWYSKRFVDFGSFEESKNRNSSTDVISFSFEFDVLNHNLFLIRRSHLYNYSKGISKNFDKGVTKCKVEIHCKKDYIEKFSILFEDHLIEIHQQDKNEKILININGMQLNEELVSGASKDLLSMLPRIFIKKADDLLEPDDYFQTKLFNKLQSIAHASTKAETIESLIDRILLSKSSNIFHSIDKDETTAHTLLEKLKQLNGDEEFEEIKQYITGMFINNLIMMTNRYLDTYFGAVKYIAPIRASAERYYRMNGLSVDEIDPQGENIPIMLASMPSLEKESFNQWSKENMGFEITTSSEGGHTSLKLKYESGEEINLADTGFGYSQILPILIVLWQTTISKKKKAYISFYDINGDESQFHLVIEQPELHLHPGLQAKLIDTFVNIISIAEEKKLKVNIIIETHSETMINRIGYLIAKGTDGFNKDLVDILIFENSRSHYETDIKKATYNENGIITNWPVGFFSPEV